jgi:DNA-binding transcriptional LysR family regulator
MYVISSRCGEYVRSPPQPFARYAVEKGANRTPRDNPRLLPSLRYRFADDLASGALVEVLPNHPPSPTPLSALYPQSRQLTLRLRVFLDWISRLFGEAKI